MSLPEVQVVGSSLKKCHVAPSPLATQTAPLAARGIAHSTRGEFCTANVPPSHDISQLAPAPGRKRSAIQLPRSDMSGSAADDLDSPNNLIRQILAIYWIHFCPQSRSKLRQCCRLSLLNYHSSSIQDTLDKTLPNLLTFPVLQIINWGDNRRLNTLLTAITSHQKGSDYFATLWTAIMTMGPTSIVRSYSLTHI